MDSWKYNIGDDIFFEGTVYTVEMKVEDRYIIKDKTFGTYFGVSREEIEKGARPIENQKEEISMEKTNVSNAVEHPSYYQGKIEVIDFIEDKGLGFSLGNCIKYIARAGKKNPEKLLEDLKKARWYLDREISRIGKKETNRVTNGKIPTKQVYIGDDGNVYNSKEAYNELRGV